MPFIIALGSNYDISQIISFYQLQFLIGYLIFCFRNLKLTN